MSELIIGNPYMENTIQTWTWTRMHKPIRMSSALNKNNSDSYVGLVMRIYNHCTQIECKYAFANFSFFLC